jgi:hypothetical protein
MIFFMADGCVTILVDRRFSDKGARVGTRTLRGTAVGYGWASLTPVRLVSAETAADLTGIFELLHRSLALPVQSFAERFIAVLAPVRGWG